MIIKYPENTTEFNIYVDNRTSSYYSSKAVDLADKYSRADNLFRELFIKYLSPGSNILDDALGRDARWDL